MAFYKIVVSVFIMLFSVCAQAQEAEGDQMQAEDMQQNQSSPLPQPQSIQPIPSTSPPEQKDQTLTETNSNPAATASSQIQGAQDKSKQDSEKDKKKNNSKWKWHKDGKHSDNDGSWNRNRVVVVPQREVIYVNPPVVYAPQSSIVDNTLYDEKAAYVRVRCSGSSALPTNVLSSGFNGTVSYRYGKGQGRIVPSPGSTLIADLVGAKIDTASEICAAQSLEYAAENTQVIWDNDNNTYVIQPGRVSESYGNYCRAYEARVLIGGQLRKGMGTACRQLDGSWDLQN